MDKYAAFVIIGIAVVVMVGLMFSEFMSTWEKIELARSAAACAELSLVP